MTITSSYFLLFVTVGAIIYYIIPKSWQWLELLFLSLIFYYYAGTPYTIIYLIISTLAAYISTIVIQERRNKIGGRQTGLAVIVFSGLAVNIGLWFMLKGRDIWSFFMLKIQEHFYIAPVETLLNVQLISALGMGYYTLQIMGYIIDCYWENAQPQKNPFKLFLFTAYFPQLTTGPISRYGEMKVLYDKHEFSYQNIAFGAQRILWGFVKKIVLAERVGILVSAIINSPETYTGFYSWIAILLYPLQMYADFSGCMDIILGVSELFDIHLAENFRNPFFARTSQEFWQRWHITLGAWAKDYVLYPLLKTPVMIKIGKFGKRKFGKKAGKFLVNALGMFVLWMVMGIWHGGFKYIVGVSLWYWIILMLGDLLASVFKKTTTALHMKTDSFSWHFFQSGRTYLIYAVGAAFFNQGIYKGMAMLLDAWSVMSVKNYANPWIFFDGSILTTGITHRDINIILFTTALLIIVGCLREKYGYARIWIQNQGVLFRWFIWIGLFVFVLICGEYGPGYSAAEFIYQGF